MPFEKQNTKARVEYDFGLHMGRRSNKFEIICIQDVPKQITFMMHFI